MAIAVSAHGLARGTLLPEGVTVRETVPQAHKVALSTLPEGAPIIRYGQVIGHAAREIEAGSWVREDVIRMPSAPDLSQLSLATAVPMPASPDRKSVV